MSASARRGAIAAALAVVVGLSCWWGTRPPATDGAAGAAASVEPSRTDAAASPVRAPRQRDKPDADAPATEEAGVAEAPPEQKPVPLTVRVLSAVDDAPIAGATVRVEDWNKDEKRERTATTDSTGAAVVMTFPLCDGPDVLVSADGYVRSGWERTPFGEKPGDDVVVMRLAPATTLEGRVLDAATGAPLAGAKVTAGVGGEPQMHCFGGGPPPYAEFVTGADGTFRLDGVPTAGATTVRAEANGRVAKSVEWDGDLSRSIELRLWPTPPGVIRGVVRDAAGAPVKELPVFVRAVDDKFGPVYVRTADDGRYEFVGLAVDRTYDVWAEDPPVGTAVTHDVRLTADAPTAQRDLVTVRPSELVLRVRDTDGKRVAKAHVWVASFSGLVRFEFDAAGESTTVFVTPGRNRIEATAPGFVPHAEDVLVTAESKHVLDIVLDRDAVISGVVVDERGAPVSGVLVRGHSEAHPQNDVVTPAGDDGAFRLTGCVPGASYSVTADEQDESATTTSAPKQNLRLTITQRGALTFRAKGLPESFIRIALASSDGERSFSVGLSWSDDVREGKSVIGAGAWDVVLSVSGFAPVACRVVIRPGETTDLGEIVFDRGVALSGRVVDAQGRGVAGARVEAMVGGEPADHVAWTDASGAFRVFRLPAGELTLIVAAEGFAARREKRVARADAAPTVVALRRVGSVRGRIVDPARRHADDELFVRAFHQTLDLADMDRVSFPVDEQGAFVQRLTPGAWNLEVLGARDAVLGAKVVLVREGEETDVEIVLER